MATAIATVGAAVIGSRASSKASKAASDSAERGQDILAQSREQARQDVQRLFPEALKAQTQGFANAQDFLTGQVIPQQLRSFQQGNTQAQETLLAGLPQIKNALLGGNVDFSGLQPKTTAFEDFTGTFKPFVSRETPKPTTPNLNPFLDALNGKLGGLGGTFGLNGFNGIQGSGTKNIGILDFQDSFR